MDTGPRVVHLLGQLHGHAPHQIDQGGEALGIGGREVGELNPEQRPGGPEKLCVAAHRRGVAQGVALAVGKLHGHRGRQRDERKRAGALVDAHGEVGLVRRGGSRRVLGEIGGEQRVIGRALLGSRQRLFGVRVAQGQLRIGPGEERRRARHNGHHDYEQGNRPEEDHLAAAPLGLNLLGVAAPGAAPSVIGVALAARGAHVHLVHHAAVGSAAAASVGEVDAGRTVGAGSVPPPSGGAALHMGANHGIVHASGDATGLGGRRGLFAMQCHGRP